MQNFQKCGALRSESKQMQGQNPRWYLWRKSARWWRVRRARRGRERSGRERRRTKEKNQRTSSSPFLLSRSLLPSLSFFFLVFSSLFFKFFLRRRRRTRKYWRSLLRFQDTALLSSVFLFSSLSISLRIYYARNQVTRDARVFIDVPKK